ncbi:hypothetical protein LSH36_397g01020 [Paralvinella palmiformis]|uniref:Uncharacterized protein n=1 Tax=Paralvinella palmiformis TaxID=53620 RepID=A0AAD9MYM3_9ANNE|nr:hypothetical protein LSH36_397g01020 [Paralvinella palmiformis]
MRRYPAKPTARLNSKPTSPPTLRSRDETKPVKYRLWPRKKVGKINAVETLLETYLAFCGMAVSNAQALEAYSREYDRNKALLEVVHSLFEEQTSVEGVVLKIMNKAQALLKCERCIVMLKTQQDLSPDVSHASLAICLPICLSICLPLSLSFHPYVS